MATRDINDAVPLLQRTWVQLQEQWSKVHPSDPVPFLTNVYRSNEEQNALYAQGRQPLDVVNALRGKVKLAPIKQAENKRVTNAQAGQSKHNKKPSEAFDIAFKDKKGQLDWSPKLFVQAWNIVKTVPGVKWGGHFRSVDQPHFEV